MPFLSIEALYIIPAVALSVVIFFIIRQRTTRQALREGDLRREVEAYNVGRSAGANGQSPIPEMRLGDIEKTISLVTSALSSQQKVIEGFSGANANHSAEIDTLKSRLRELQREYDTILSENYSLRAKVRKLEERSGRGQAARGHSPDADRASRENSPLADTRILSAMNLEDTTELDILPSRKQADAS